MLLDNWELGEKHDKLVLDNADEKLFLLCLLMVGTVLLDNWDLGEEHNGLVLNSADTKLFLLCLLMVGALLLDNQELGEEYDELVLDKSWLSSGSVSSSATISSEFVEVVKALWLLASSSTGLAMFWHKW